MGSPRCPDLWARIMAAIGAGLVWWNVPNTLAAWCDMSIAVVVSLVAWGMMGGWYAE
jgi:hypothetical protein